MILNEEQQETFDAIVANLESPGGSNCENVFYVDGPAGAGKTYLYTKLLRYVRGHGGIALAVAMSGIAALLLEGGRTAHSRFRLPVPLPLEGATCGVRPRSALAQLLTDCNLIIWDEAPTAPKAAVQSVD